MAYAVSDIITWAKVCQPLARYYQSKNLATKKGSIDNNLDVELYITRRDVEYAYAQDPSSADTFTIANYLLTLCGVYLFKAQQTTGGGGSISPITPVTTPEQLNFVVIDSGTPLITGQSSTTFSDFIGFNLTVVMNGQPITQITTAPIYYTWNSLTGLFTLSQPATVDDEFQITPV